MILLKTWKIEDTTGNTVSFVAPSKTAAIKQYKRLISFGRVKIVTDMGEAKPPRQETVALPGVPDPNPFRPVEPIVNKNVVPGPNDPCKCGSGKKYKRCCRRPAPRPRPESVPVSTSVPTSVTEPVSMPVTAPVPIPATEPVTSDDTIKE